MWEGVSFLGCVEHIMAGFDRLTQRGVDVMYTHLLRTHWPDRQLRKCVYITFTLLHVTQEKRVNRARQRHALDHFDSKSC